MAHACRLSISLASLALQASSGFLGPPAVVAPQARPLPVASRLSRPSVRATVSATPVLSEAVHETGSHGDVVPSLATRPSVGMAGARLADALSSDLAAMVGKPRSTAEAAEVALGSGSVSSLERTGVMMSLAALLLAALAARGRGWRSPAATEVRIDAEVELNDASQKLAMAIFAGATVSKSDVRSSPTKRSFFGASAPTAADVVDLGPSWDELRSKLEALQTPEEKDFRANLAAGRGPPNAMANLRVFDKDEAEAKKVTLYRDSASWCPYCQKVWMFLEEKQIPYNVKRVNMNCYGDKPDEFLRLQPNGCIPVAEIDGRVLGSSDEIIRALLDTPGSSPELDKSLDPFDSPESSSLLRLDQQLGGAWLDWVRGGDPGPDNRFIAGLTKLEAALNADKSGPYFLGERFTLIDIMYTPYFERAVASLAYFKGFNIRDSTKYPAINTWLDALDTRPSVQAAKSDYYTHSYDLPPQIGGCGAINAGAHVREDIDGGAWKFPLRDSIEPDWGWISAAQARREAAERMTHNAANIARFAARGAGSPGFPPAWAELSDPNAQPAEDWVPAIDVFLRHATALLLAGDADAADRADNTPERSKAWEAAQEAVASVPTDSRDELAKCLEYLQKRIGVPRDMSLPAARRLRAELGELIDALRTSS